jgi:hypothetical protein
VPLVGSPANGIPVVFWNGLHYRPFQRSPRAPHLIPRFLKTQGWSAPATRGGAGNWATSSVACHRWRFCGRGWQKCHFRSGPSRLSCFLVIVILPFRNWVRLLNHRINGFPSRELELLVPKPLHESMPSYPSSYIVIATALSQSGKRS